MDTNTNLIQLVEKRTHRQGHIQDESDDLVMGVSVSSMSDHFLVNTEVSLEWTFFSATSVSYRNYRLVDINVFLLDLKNTQLLLDPP